MIVVSGEQRSKVFECANRDVSRFGLQKKVRPYTVAKR